MVDSAAVLLELRGRLAEKPSWGRQDLLVLIAELEVQHRVDEDELERALRLVQPTLMDTLFNRLPALARAAMVAPAPDDGEQIADRDAQGDRHSIAVG